MRTRKNCEKSKRYRKSLTQVFAESVRRLADVLPEIFTDKEKSGHKVWTVPALFKVARYMNNAENLYGVALLKTKRLKNEKQCVVVAAYFFTIPSISQQF